MSEDKNRELTAQLLLHFHQRQLESGKWLLASLLVINGAALIAILSSESVAEAPDLRFTYFFVAGIVCAFIAGAASWLYSGSIARAIRETLKFEISEEDELLGGRPDKIMFFVLPMWAFSVFSLGMFVFGCVGAAQALGG
ncbi:MAG: hypothetical protein AAF559_14090 [Pseudomonadota bacterium]